MDNYFNNEKEKKVTNNPMENLQGNTITNQSPIQSVQQQDYRLKDYPERAIKTLQQQNKIQDQQQEIPQQEPVKQEQYSGAAINKAAKEARAKEIENIDRYGIELSQEEYDILNKAIANSDNPEDQAYRFGTAIQYSRMYGVPFDEAVQNIDRYNAALWGSETKKTPKEWYHAVTDAWILGNNTMKQADIGNKMRMAEVQGNKELYNNLLEQYNLLAQDNELLQDDCPRAWYIDALKYGMESAPFTLTAAGAGILGSLIAPGVGEFGSFAVSAYQSAGLEYADLRANGASHKAADFVSLLSGGLQGVVEVALGDVPALKAAGEGSSKLIQKAASKITEKLFKKMHYSGTFRTLAQTITKLGIDYSEEVIEEGLEEAVQNVISEGGKQLTSILSDEYNLDEKTAGQIAAETFDSFKGGVLGSLVLSGLPLAANAKATYEDYSGIKDDAIKNQSKESFIKDTKEKIKTGETHAFDEVKDKKVDEVLSDVYDNFKEERSKAYKEAVDETADIKESRDLAEGKQEQETDEEGERVAFTSEYRDEEGKIYIQEDTDVESTEGDTSKGRILAGDPTRPHANEESGNRYGYIDYEQKGDTVRITDFKMSPGRQNLAEELYESFAEKFAGKDIKWDPKYETNTNLKMRIVQNNPQGIKAGLNYFADEASIESNREKIKLSKDFRKWLPNWKNEQIAAGVALTQAAANAKNMTLDEYTKTYFQDGKMFTAVEGSGLEQAAEGQTVYGATQFDEDSRAIIYVSKHADFNTFTHELAHVFRKTLDQDQLEKAAAAFNVNDANNWTRSEEETFADGFVDYLRTGKAPTKGLKELFEKAARFIADIIRGLQGTIDLSDDIKSVYDGLLKDDESGLSKAIAAANAAEKEDIGKAKYDTAQARETAAKEQATEEETTEQTETTKEVETKSETEQNTEILDNMQKETVDNPDLSTSEKAETVTDAAGFTRAEKIEDDYSQYPDALFQKNYKIRKGLKNTDAITNYLESKLKSLGFDIERGYSGLSDSEYITIENYKDITGKESPYNGDELKIRISGHDLPISYDKLHGYFDIDIKSGENNRAGSNGDATYYDLFLQNIISEKENHYVPNIDDPLIKWLYDNTNEDLSNFDEAISNKKAEIEEDIKDKNKLLDTYKKPGNEVYYNMAGKNTENAIKEDEDLLDKLSKIKKEDISKFKKENILFQTAYHGSPHNFDKFTTEAIGTGEGNQSFGWGLYFTNQEAIARDYAKTLTARPVNVKLNQLNISLDSKKDYLKQKKAALRNTENVEKYNNKILKNIKYDEKELKAALKDGDESTAKFYQDLIDTSNKQLSEEYRLSIINDLNNDINKTNEEIKELKKEIKIEQKKAENVEANRNLYTVDLPDDGYILWDKEYTDAELKPIKEALYNRIVDEYFGGDKESAREEVEALSDGINGESLYHGIQAELGSDKAASLFLRDLGYTGIDYPANSVSGNIQDGKRNYVIFDENNVEVNDHILFQLVENKQEEDIRQMYEGTDKWMKAPNGNPTNLSEKQWLTVRTDNFKKWFGDWENNQDEASKVVDDNGEPLIVYHGTDWNIFNEAPENAIFKNRDTYHFGTKEQSKLRIHDYIDYLRNEIEENKNILSDNVSETEKRIAYDNIEKYQNRIKGFEENNIYEMFLNIRNIKEEKDENEWSDKAVIAKREGYDGFVYRNLYENDGKNSYAVFEPNQIKSATNNTGHFNPLNPSILFQTAYHGSPHNFDKFTTKKIGTGEGNQFFGWGLYFTNNKDIARWYADSVTNDQEYFNKQDRVQKLEITIKAEEKVLETKENSLLTLTNEEEIEKTKRYIDSIKQVLEQVNKDLVIAKKELLEAKENNKKNIYTVEIPDKNYLQWDKTLSEEEIENIANVFANKFYNFMLETDGNTEEEKQNYRNNKIDTINNFKNKFIEEAKSERNYTGKAAREHLKGKTIYFASRESKKERLVSEWLNEAGYAGIEYPANSIQGKIEKDKRNFVLFNDKDVSIKEHILFQLVNAIDEAELEPEDEGRNKIQQLAIAKIMETGNKSGADIEKATGWKRNEQNKWSFNPNVDIDVNNKDLYKSTKVYSTEYELGKAVLDLTNDVDDNDKKSMQQAQQTLFQKVYHGTSKEFYKFDMQHLSEGRGSQNFGRGLYFTSDKQMARDYATKEKQRTNGHGYIYKADIPDTYYLDWDADIAKSQIDKVADAYAKDVPGASADDIKIIYTDGLPVDGGYLYYYLMTKAADQTSNTNDKNKLVSKWLADAGMAGVRYSAEYNGGSPDIENYVVFDDRKIKVLERTLFQLGDDRNNILYQTDEELMKEAADYDTWQDWKEFTEAMFIDEEDEDRLIPKDADDEWYKTTWEKAKQIKENNAHSDENIDKMSGIGEIQDEDEKDTEWYAMMEEDGMIDEFLMKMQRILWPHKEDMYEPADEEEKAQLEAQQQLRNRIDIETGHKTWGTALLRARGDSKFGDIVNLKPTHRKRVMTLIRNNKRDYRDLYAAVMNKPELAVAEDAKTTTDLKTRMAQRKYDIASPDIDFESLTPEKRREFADVLDFEDLRREVKHGTLQMDPEYISQLIISYNKEIKRLRKDIANLKKANTESEMALRKTYDQLEKKEAELKEKMHLKRQAEGVRDLKVRLIKNINRKVNFKRIAYKEGKQIIAIQELFHPILRKFVNKFINMEGPYIRDALSLYKTDKSFEDKLKAIYSETRSRNAKRMLYIFDYIPYDKWTIEDKELVAKTLPKPDWVQSLDLDELEKKRAGTLQLDLQSEETQELIREALPDDLLALLTSKDLKTWSLEEMESLVKVVNDLFKEGRDNLNAIREAAIEKAEAAQEKIRAALKSSGIVINADDSPAEKERKQKAIDKFTKKQLPKILGQDNPIKGTLEASAARQSFMGKILHGYGDANIRRVARILDNGKEGINTTLLYYRENDCFNREQRAIQKRTEDINKILAENDITLEDLYKPMEVTFPDGGKQNFTIDELLFMEAANADDTSRAAVACGNMYDETVKCKFRYSKDAQLDYEQMAMARYYACLEVAKTIPENIRKLLYAIEHDYDQQYDLMNKVSIEEYNEPVWRVEHYVPLNRLESNGDENANRVKEDLLAASGSYAKTFGWVDRGMTKKRVEISPANQRPVQLGLYSTWTESMQRTEHFIAYAAYLRDLNRIYKGRNSGAVRQMMENRYGRGMVSYIDQYINETANPKALAPKTQLDRIVHALRGKTAPAYLSWKMSAIVKQLCTSPWPFMQYVSPWKYASAAIEFATNKNIRDAIKTKSAYMNSRVYDPIVDLVNEQKMKATDKAKHALTSFEAMGMKGLEEVDWVCVAPGWLAVYKDEYARLSNKEYQDKLVAEKRKEYEQYSDVYGWDWVDAQAETARMTESEIEEKAVLKADDVTRMCQPSSRSTDLSPIFKESNEMAKVFLQFTTSLNVIWQNIRYDLPNAVRERQWKQVIGTIAGYTLAGIAVGLVSEGLGGDDDDDEKKAGQLAFYAMSQFTDSVPVIGSMLSNTVESTLTDEWKFTSSNNLFPITTKAINGVKYITKEDWEKAAENFGEAAGLSLGLPVSGVKEILTTAGVGHDEGFYPQAELGRRPEK